MGISCQSLQRPASRPRSSGNHLVRASGEDQAIHVIATVTERRAMDSRRLAIECNDQTLLVFGVVYVLPLLRDARAVVASAGLARDPHRLRLLHPVHLLVLKAPARVDECAAPNGAALSWCTSWAGLLDDRRIDQRYVFKKQPAKLELEATIRRVLSDTFHTCNKGKLASTGLVAEVLATRSCSRAFGQSVERPRCVVDVVDARDDGAVRVHAHRASTPAYGPLPEGTPSTPRRRRNSCLSSHIETATVVKQPRPRVDAPRRLLRRRRRRRRSPPGGGGGTPPGGGGGGGGGAAPTSVISWFAPSSSLTGFPVVVLQRSSQPPSTKASQSLL